MVSRLVPTHRHTPSPFEYSSYRQGGRRCTMIVKTLNAQFPVIRTFDFLRRPVIGQNLFG